MPIQDPIQDPIRDTSQSRRAWTRLRWATLLSLVVHLVAGLAMALVLRHGLETNPDFSSRLRFVVENRTAWTWAWLTWHAAALSILWFFLCFRTAHESTESSRVGLQLAVILVAAAIVPDLIAESMEIGVLPELARDALTEDGSTEAFARRELYRTIHRVSVMMTGYLANGLYTLSTVLAVWCTRRVYVPWVQAAGFAVGVSGLALSASALADSVEGLFWSNAALVPALVAWQVGVFLDASQRRHGPSHNE